MKSNLSLISRILCPLRFRQASKCPSARFVQQAGVLVFFTATIAVAQPAANTPVPAVPAKFLAADADSKEIQVRPEEVVARFTFYVTNVSDATVVITNLLRTCGCTEASMPAQPWTLEPGASGPIQASIDLRGKAGKISKPLTIQSPSGSKVLILNVTIPPPSPAPSANADRGRNQQIAARDRQAVFKGDCAKCHAEPTVGKLGHELYQAGCAICHDAENRAAMVPDLKALGHPLNADDWKGWITSSKPGSMMPAFGRKNEGPLNEEQIASLVDYLSRTTRNGS